MLEKAKKTAIVLRLKTTMQVENHSTADKNWLSASHQQYRFNYPSIMTAYNEYQIALRLVTIMPGNRVIK